ncbi:MAG: Abi-alpha family protein [Thermodesulfobacteriota bacterium]|nr:Abi-alpha family protein [Thermodesulfobacteriota bacterium]
MSEEAKAAQEIAKATGKGIEAATQMGSFLQTVFGEALIEYGRSWHDKSKLYRYKNFLNIMDKVLEIHRGRRAEGKPIPITPRFAIPLMWHASLEDEKSVQEMWASLIANATDSDKRLNIKKVFVDILSNLEPIDTLVLRDVYSLGNMFRGKGHKRNVHKLSKQLDVVISEIDMSLMNLVRLGCIVEDKGESVKIPGYRHAFSRDNFLYSLTPLGRLLMTACEA